ncbi:MAG TPA: transglutaminase-like domain-containing protein [Candidatus Angelobacter sp.]|nr:transglutaminase-like domain-containing protein [Candidatus Angelobacter sp.]
MAYLAVSSSPSRTNTRNPFVPPPAVKMTIADGEIGTAQTIDKIRKLIREGMTDREVNRQAIAIVQQSGVPAFDFAGEVRAVYEWVLRNIRFVRDIAGVETLRGAREILTVRAGDCDDINGILLPTLLATIGAHVRLVTISSHPQFPADFSHIYCEVEINGCWIALDAARRNAAFGREPQHYFRKRVWSVTSAEFQDVGRLGYYRGYMGDDTTDGSTGFDWSSLANIITAGTTGAANIIKSLTPQIPGPLAYTRNAAGQLVPVGSAMISSVPGGVNVSGEGAIPNWMIFGGLGLLAVLAFKH